MMILDGDLERRSNNFDLIRLVAALFVLIGHAPAILYNQGFSFDPFHAIFGLRMQTLGVCVFFIVSGFLVSRSWEKRKSVYGFFVSRLLRIFPALIGVVLLSVLVLGPCLTTLNLADYFASPITAKYLQNISLYRMYYQLPGVFESNPHPGSVNGSLWTLPYEFTCYMLLVVLGSFKVLENRYATLLFALMLFISYWLFQPILDVVVLPVFGIDFKNFLPLLIYFSTGMVFYQFRNSLRFGWLGWAFCGVVCVLIQLGIIPQIMIAWILPYLVLSISFSKKIKFNDFGRYGDFSYGFFLYAFPIQQLIVYLSPFKLTVFPMVMLSIVCTLPFAIVSWRLIEKPALGLRSWLIKS